MAEVPTFDELVQKMMDKGVMSDRRRAIQDEQEARAIEAAASEARLEETRSLAAAAARAERYNKRSQRDIAAAALRKDCAQFVDLAGRKGLGPNHKFESLEERERLIFSGTKMVPISNRGWLINRQVVQFPSGGDLYSNGGGSITRLARHDESPYAKPEVREEIISFEVLSPRARLYAHQNTEPAEEIIPEHLKVYEIQNIRERLATATIRFGMAD